MVRKVRKTPTPEQVFYDGITQLIRNLLIDNVNYRNGHYNDQSVFALVRDTKERAGYILERLEGTKHLILEED